MAASTLPFVFGLLGNIVSFMVYLAPLPTFYRIYKKKSTEGFQALPYAVALFSAMLLLYYGYIKPDNRMILITINSIGSVIETIYIILFLIYATKEALVYTMKLLILFNVVAYGLIVSTTFFLAEGAHRVTIVGWICAVFSVCVFAAPLSIMRLVIKTKSVEYMPFNLSFFLTLCAVMWFFYGLLIKDYYVATPNVLGFFFGIAQMILYVIYKDRKKQIIPVAVQQKDTEVPAATVVDLGVILEKTGVDLGAILGFQEKAGVDVGVIVELQDKAAVEFGVLLETQQNRVTEIEVEEADNNRQDEITKEYCSLDGIKPEGEKTIEPLIIECKA